MSIELDQPDVARAAIELPAEDILVSIAGQALSMATQSKRRVLIGITGGPGSGKSTMTDALVGMLNDMVPHSAATFGMDGFHRRHEDLVQAGDVHEKGKPHTFDATGFADALTRVKNSKTDIWLPTYSREIEDVVDDGQMIAGNIPIIIVEGIYLLLEQGDWAKVLPLLDLSIFLMVDRDVIIKRLTKRHAEHGLFSEERNIQHIENVDMVNFDLVAETRHRAEQIFVVSDA